MTENTHIKYSQDLIIDDIARFEKLYPSYHTGIKERPKENLGSSIQEVLGVFNMAIAAEIDKKEVLRYLNMLCSVGTANFKFGAVVAPKFTMNLNDESFELESEIKTDYMDTDSWLMAFFSSVLMRDKEAIAVLNSIPEEVFLSSNIKPNSFDLAYVRFMKGLYNPEAAIGSMLKNAMEALFDETLTGTRYEYSDSILFPLISLARCMLTSDEEGFNEALESAIISHKEFWGAEENKFDSTGWASLPLMAMCAMVYDAKGFNITIKSNYLPLWLIKG